MRIRNALFAIFFCVFLLGPATLWIGQDKLQLDIPSWLTADDAKYLSGGISRTDVKSNLNSVGFTSGKLQDAFEKKIGNYIPMKTSAILGDALLQRKAIECSNYLFSWNCYPTYFGSDVLYDSRSQSLCPSPSMKSAESVDKALSNIESFGKELSMFASQNPDIEICIAIPTYAPNSSLNPAWDLVSQKWNQKDAIDIWNKQMANSENVHIAYQDIYDYSDYLKYYYRCDSHWNGYGALETCKYVEKFLDLPFCLEPDTKMDSLNRYLYFGQLGRRGKVLLNEQARLDEPMFEVNNLDVSESLSDAHILASGGLNPQESTYAMFNFYQWFYGADTSSVIKNKQNPNDEVSLIICDSYGDAFRWVFAPSCKETHSIYDLHRLSENHSNLATHLQDTHATKLVFCACPENYSTFIERYPDYFKME